MTRRAVRFARSGETLNLHVAVARTPWDRALGLMFRRDVPEGFGMLFPDCSAVHTVGVLTDIDIVFLDGAGIVRDVRHRVAPMRPVVTAPGSDAVLELRGGAAAALGITTGQRLCFD